ncbi:glycosyltransferase [Allorhizocola rhizosphaerae]|uniref:glycosyltransferase n=1 Tax=Allorhizocola rhizosphaerae TaxID=1872709 RepID=UPI000E3B86C8|nr:glycosyltransferase family 2 protein [Allorhizocola rhizosphaerae]
MSGPRIAVVVVTYHSARVLPGLFESLSEGLRGCDWELIIADNNSGDDTLEVVQELMPSSKVVEVGYNAGYAAAFNAGLAKAKDYDAAMILNPDIRLRPGSALALYRALGAGVGIAVPRMSDEDGRLTHSLRREPTLSRALGEAVLGQRAGRHPALGETVLDEAAYRTDTTVDWATGAVMLMSAQCLAATGPWDESFFLYAEETDFALRARDRGFRTVLVARAEAVHLGGQSAGANGGRSRVSPALWSLLTVNKIRLYRKRHSRLATAVYWSLVFMRESTRAVLGHPRSRSATKALLRPSKPELR